MQAKSINGALLALRKQIISGKLDGLAHFEALLVMRGVELPEVRIAKKADVARRGHMRALVFEVLRVRTHNQKMTVAARAMAE
uniref:hypothetical protein n=1 Tax=Planktotalea sp. TaxID=2029877 RepID=UPI0025FD4587